MHEVETRKRESLGYWIDPREDSYAGSVYSSVNIGEMQLVERVHLHGVAADSLPSRLDLDSHGEEVPKVEALRAGAFNLADPATIGHVMSRECKDEGCGDRKALRQAL